MTVATDNGGPPKQVPIRIATYNLQSGRGGRLESAIRSIAQMNVDLCFFTEAKLTDGIYTRRNRGYTVHATNAMSNQQGGVALVFRASSYWQVESIREFGPNVISCRLVTGRRTIGLIGAYVPPNDLDTMQYVHQAVDFLEGNSVVLLGDLNVELEVPRGDQALSIAADVAGFGLEDLRSHFKRRKNLRSDFTWWQHCDG